ncbi:hypothetical protein C942_02367 [Photobacterium marinum]|uniref:GlyGly-CTERM sorting domain-containing protein n=1 Tax=Photobacterium marinum TaxID=1056511 RepID=L8JAH5_9GAMM|nr:DUF3466 family protein [Photobacterium marinum]ELR64554.1 hypothetical protein C942_02367 [Photobacterium marinum]
MQQKTLKLSTLAILIAGATQANAAVYKVVEVDQQKLAESDVIAQGYENKSLNDRVETYAEAIEASTGLNCFDSGAGCTDDKFKVVGESRVGTDGINYRDEVAFTYDNYHEVNDYSGFLSYCNQNIGFNTCDIWANQQYYGLDYNTTAANDGSGYGGLHREHLAWNKGYFANALPFAEQSDGSLKRVENFSSTRDNYLAKDQLGNIVDTHQTANGVVSGLGKLSAEDYTFGVTSSAYFYNGSRYARQFNKRGFLNLGSDEFVLNPPSTVSTLVTNMGQTIASDAVELDDGLGNKKLLVVGSSAFSKANFDDERKLPDSDNDGFDLNTSTFKTCGTGDVNFLYANRECQHAVFATDAAFWVVDSSTTTSPEAKFLANRVDRNGNAYTALDPDENDRSFQGAARAVAIVDNKPVVVGYSTDSVGDNSNNNNNADFYAISASIYTPVDNFDLSKDNQWERKLIPGLNIKQGDRTYRYTIATDINTKNQVVGVAKSYNSQNRSYAEKMFVYDNTNDSLKFLDSSIDSSVFFNGYNGFAASINNNGQLVGWIDSETANQVDGRIRRQRAFTYMASEDIANSPLKANKAWLLDDLTYSSDVSDTVATVNNAFRIAHATDINDAGVISATAFKCDGGYSSATQGAQCASTERVVAVKLVPIPDGTIQQRPEDNSIIEREGASFGLFGLTLLGLFGFRRRK